MANKEIPIGVKIISILGYLSAVFGVIMSILLVTREGVYTYMSNIIPFSGLYLSFAFFLDSLVFMIFGILAFFIAMGLWKAKSWARTIAIIISFLRTIIALIFLTLTDLPIVAISLIIGIVINLIISFYLMFDKNVKNAFA